MMPHVCNLPFTAAVLHNTLPVPSGNAAACNIAALRHQNILEAPKLCIALFVGNNFKVHGSVHRNNILIYVQQYATLHSLFYLETAPHVSGGTTTHNQERKTTVSTASGICHTVTATCRDSGR